MQQVLCQSEFSTECDLELWLSNSSIFFALKVIKQLLTSFTASSRAFYISIFSPITFLSKMWPIHQAFSFYYMRNAPFLVDSTYYFIYHAIGATDLLHPSPAPYLKPSRYFWSTLRSVKVPAPYTAVLHKYNISLDSSLNFLLDERRFCHGNPRFIFTGTSCVIC